MKLVVLCIGVDSNMGNWGSEPPNNIHFCTHPNNFRSLWIIQNKPLVI